ncbi:glycerophosphodiester phosphodiesterase family protein [Novosphingobium sp.]|uniref:glycerophosphodiester phosphodiesterase family protein n=1 Tax=Novosphingobium sp. TaxID=1874826 RepID=UPI0035B0E5CF
MRRWIKRIALVLAVLFLVLTFINASWLADSPRGYVKLVAHRGTMQQFSHVGLGDQDCTATRIEPPLHDYLENTVSAINSAKRLGAQVVEIDIAPTADGKIALFHDAALDCRTNGKGPTGAATLAQLQTLDAGYGYSADGGKTFPFRGKAIGAIPSLEQGLDAAGNTALIYNFKTRDPEHADRLIAALKAAGRDPVARGDGFSGPEPLIARVRTAFPGVWAFSPDSVKACTIGYLKTGWLTLVPESCRNGTMFVPLNYQWAFAGWPDRLIARMEAVGGRVVVIADRGKDRPMGLDLPEQLGEVPRSFNGYVWVDDMWSVGPALRPAYNKRNPREEAELAKALEARRAARD